MFRKASKLSFDAAHAILCCHAACRAPDATLDARIQETAADRCRSFVSVGYNSSIIQHAGVVPSVHHF